MLMAQVVESVSLHKKISLTNSRDTSSTVGIIPLMELPHLHIYLSVRLEFHAVEAVLDRMWQEDPNPK